MLGKDFGDCMLKNNKFSPLLELYHSRNKNNSSKIQSDALFFSWRAWAFFAASGIFMVSLLFIHSGYFERINHSLRASGNPAKTPLGNAEHVESWASDEFKIIMAAYNEKQRFLPKEEFPRKEQQKQLVTDWISKRYRVASDSIDVFVSAAYLTAHEMKLDPLLILAVMAIESSFDPSAESHAGAQGLMQVMTSVHSDKFEKLGGIEAALDPVANIKVGARILKEYVARGGSVEKGLKRYVGAAAMKSDQGYGEKVLAEYDRLKEVARGQKVPALIVAKPSLRKNASGNTRQVSGESGNAAPENQM